jgi:quercetin dioxygenase-like cupin family protein
MARVRIHEEAKLQWVVPGASVPAERASEFTEGELTARVRIREPGSADKPQLIEIRYAPNSEVQLHAHEADEIIFVRAGLMRAGNRTLRPGDSIYIAGGTFYSFRAGPDGLQILNFRPREDVTFITPKSRTNFETS